MVRHENKVIIKFGKVTSAYAKMIMDMRMCFEPAVSRKLQEEKSWKIKDYVKLAKHFLSSHIFAFSQSEEFNNLRIISLREGGSTFYFKINKYLHASGIAQTDITHGERINGYFIVPFNIDKNDPIMPMIEDLKRNAPVSHLTSRALVIKKVAEYEYLFSHYAIKKEEKEGKANLVKLSLVEKGPRLEMKLQKIEDGVCSGNATFHSYIQKSSEELSARDEMLKQRNTLKMQRKLEQEKNVLKKKMKKRRRISENEDVTKESSSSENKENEEQ
ncbi:hypothetical protein NEFER03_1459 [Nematocida sp. LUAm3]|nr:hypothetical protein NEFER03_1459 [Nematocida sp. LUAm3]KAI5174711.1 hypothetical protein NEFER02_0821 [Nematocida sp. LUAm2]KAI5177878.1 hypothetical protein NEFER01_1080 [Nematocida sp. LUAm1]